MSNDIDIDLIDVLNEAFRNERADIHTAMPGQVVHYYPSTQTADVQLMLKKPDFDPDTGMRNDPVTYPMLPNIPVMWPRAGGYQVVLPMTSGDFVWVSFSEGGTSEFRLTGQESEPFDVSRHQVTYAACTPGVFPNSQPINDASVTGGSRAVVGKSGGAQVQFDGSHVIMTDSGSTSDPGDFAARANLVDSIFTALNTFMTSLTTYATGIQAIADPANSFTPALLTAITAFQASVITVKSNLVKLK